MNDTVDMALQEQDTDEQLRFKQGEEQGIAPEALEQDGTEGETSEATA